MTKRIGEDIPLGIAYLRTTFQLSNDEDLIRTSTNKLAETVDKSTGYKRVSILGKLHKVHRVIWALHYGEWPSNAIDHIDGNKANNHISNLRLASNQENARNRKSNRSSSSVYKGVCWNKEAKKWQASSRHNGKLVHLGRFNSEIDAALAYNTYAEAKYGEFARLNQVSKDS